MSGWIKLEKDLENDPRVLRMVKRMCVTDVTQERINGARAVTQVIGALARLWMFADSHGRSDNSLDMTADELDEWLGIPGFSATMPEDWLHIRDDGTVELPDFQEHNGVEAKKRAMTQKRVEQHRSRSSNATALQPNKRSNATALPDQTRPDQTKEETHNARASPREIAVQVADDAEHLVMFQRVQKAYPPFAGRQDWINAEHHCRLLVDRGSTWTQLVDAVKRYAAYVAGGGVSSTAHVMKPGTFFSAPDRPWAQPWEPPVQTARPKPAPPKFVAPPDDPPELARA